MQPFRYYIELELEHEDGPRGAERDLRQLVTELLEAGIGSDDLIGDGRGALYRIAATKLRQLDAAQARRLVGPAMVDEPRDLTPAAEVTALAEEGKWWGKPAKPRKVALPPSDDVYKFGDVVEAIITHPNENPLDKGKRRPAVYIKHDPNTGRHALAGITTSVRFNTGEARQPITWTGGIYIKQCYLWGGQFVWIPDKDIVQTLGHLSDNDINIVARQHRVELRKVGVDPWLAHAKVS